MSQKQIYPKSIGTLEDLIQSTMLRRDWHIRWPSTLQRIISKNSTRTGLVYERRYVSKPTRLAPQDFQPLTGVSGAATDNLLTYLPVDDKAVFVHMDIPVQVIHQSPSFRSGHYMSPFELNWSPTILEGSLCQTRRCRDEIEVAQSPSCWAERYKSWANINRIVWVTE